MSNWGDYCTYCGEALSGPFPRKCMQHHITYASPVTVGVALQPVQCEDRTGLLVVQRGINPGKGHFALPGGFADQRETANTTALRELFEETLVKNSRAIYFCEDLGGSHNDKDPRCHTMYFYAMPLLQKQAINFDFHDTEVQTLQLVFLSDDKNGLQTIHGNKIELCFATHHSAAISFLQQQ